MYEFFYTIQIGALLVAAVSLYLYCQGKLHFTEKKGIADKSELLFLCAIMIMQLGYLLFLQGTDQGALITATKLYQSGLIWACAFWMMSCLEKGVWGFPIAIACEFFVLSEGTELGNLLYYGKELTHNQWFYYIQQQPTLLYQIGRIALKLMLLLTCTLMWYFRKKENTKEVTGKMMLATLLVLLSSMTCGMQVLRHYDIIPVSVMLMEVMFWFNKSKAEETASNK